MSSNKDVPIPYSKKKPKTDDTLTETFSQAFAGIEKIDQDTHQGPSSNSKKRSVDAISNFGSDSSLVEKAKNAIHDSKNINKSHLQQSLDPSDLLQPHVLLVSTKQKGNGLLRYIRNVPYAFTKIVPDYILGSNRCALFLSFRYHKLHPTYIDRRIAELKNDFDLRVLLCLVDVEDNASILLHLNKLCAFNSFSLLLAWSEEECARYLESFKAYEHADPSQLIKTKSQESTHHELVCDVFKKVNSVNKTDTAQLLMQFGNLKSIVTASMDELIQCPGIGEKKVARLFEAFNKPFSASIASKRKEEKERLANIESDIACAEEEESHVDSDENDEDHKQPLNHQSNENHSSIDAV